MPILHWLTRGQDLHASGRAPYRLLEHVESYGDKDTQNMLIQGDNLDALKALYMVGTAFAQNNDLTTVKKHVKSFAPVSVSLKNNIITIVLDEVSVSKQIYDNVISSAICMPMYLNEQSNYFSKIKEI